MLTNTKRYIGLLLLLCLSVSLFAEPVGGKQLVSAAVNAFRQKSVCEQELKDCHFVTDGSDTLLLVVNYSKGFIVLSADDAVVPVLAYSLDQQFYMDDAAPAALLWLESYTEQIKYARAHGATPSSKVAQAWASLNTTSEAKDQTAQSVAPLLTALWNQTKYYNAYSPHDVNAPSGYDQRTPNGCVAVAMAMIMYYYRYPLHGSGYHTNYTDYGNFYVNFAQQTYCYEAMTDQLTHFNNEVAKLIFHCATAVDMMYGANGSGAYSENVPGAIASYFGYSSDCQLLHRYDYSLAQWKNLIKEDLNAKRPLYYAGHNEEGGHAFVCDGYENDDYYHFNFGWGGSSNGYYVLTASDSDSNVINGFQHSQRVIRYIYPRDENYPYLCANHEIHCSDGTIEDGSGPSDYQNNSDCMYVLTEGDAYRFMIKIKSFETQQNHDSLSFWDGHPDQGNLLLTLSGTVVPGTTYYFDSDSLYITFRTDDSVTASGWRLDFRMARHENFCHNDLIQQYHGTLTDGSGPSSYKYNANCSWRLYLPHASLINFTISELDIAAGDRLAFYDWSLPDRPQIALFEENDTPRDLLFFSNYVFIELVTDNYLCGDGFELSWITDYSPDGIEEMGEDEIAVYPNPAYSNIHVRIPAHLNEAVVRLYDVTGRVVIAEKNLGDVIDVNISNLPNGFYTLMVQDGSVIYKKKIVVQH